ncbi:MAG: hypothetical protein NTV35_14175 [Chloroflexi bacterium]|nr:hypothetical protein [Chloroflexota bacterium]
MQLPSAHAAPSAFLLPNGDAEFRGLFVQELADWSKFLGRAMFYDQRRIRV